jgi:hypothetical protein
MLGEKHSKKIPSAIFLTALVLFSFFSIIVHANSDRQFQLGIDTFSFYNFDKEPLSYEDTIEVLESAEWTSSLPDWSLSLLADVVMEMNNRSEGNCWGMAYTTKYYYENPERFKNKYPEYSTINELKKEEIGPEIIYNQEISQCIMQKYVFNGILYYLGIAKLEEQIPFVLEQIDNNKPEIITIDVNWGKETSYHAVLAYDYTLSYGDKVVTLHMYDSNAPRKIQNITLLLNQTGQYNIQKMDFTLNYETTKLAAETYYEPDWDFVIQHQEEIRELILGWELPPNLIEEILKVITLIAGVSIVLIISLVLILKKYKLYRRKKI